MAVIVKPLEMDYVYHADCTGEYRNAHVSMTVQNDGVKIAIEPEHIMSCEELSDTLRNIENDVFKKSRIRLTDECNVVLIQGGQTYTVTLAEDQPRVTGMHPQAV